MLSPLQAIALICTKLDQGVSKEKIRDWLTLEDDLFSFCIEFAVENDFLIKQLDGKYRITPNGKTFVASLIPED
jgi:predicted transcriptional regulator